MLILTVSQAAVYGPVVPPGDPGGPGDATLEGWCPRAGPDDIVVCRRRPPESPYRYRELTHAYDPPDGMPRVKIKLPGGFCIIGLTIGPCH